MSTFVKCVKVQGGWVDGDVVGSLSILTSRSDVLTFFFRQPNLTGLVDEVPLAIAKLTDKQPENERTQELQGLLASVSVADDGLNFEVDRMGIKHGNDSFLMVIHAFDRQFELEFDRPAAISLSEQLIDNFIEHAEAGHLH